MQLISKEREAAILRVLKHYGINAELIIEVGNLSVRGRAEFETIKMLPADHMIVPYFYDTAAVNRAFDHGTYQIQGSVSGYGQLVSVVDREIQKLESVDSNYRELAAILTNWGIPAVQTILERHGDAVNKDIARTVRGIVK